MKQYWINGKWYRAPCLEMAFAFAGIQLPPSMAVIDVSATLIELGWLDQDLKIRAIQ